MLVPESGITTSVCGILPEKLLDRRLRPDRLYIETRECWNMECAEAAMLLDLQGPISFRPSAHALLGKRPWDEFGLHEFIRDMWIHPVPQLVC